MHFISLLLKTACCRDEVTVGDRVMVEGMVMGDGGGGGDGSGGPFFLFKTHMDVAGNN